MIRLPDGQKGQIQSPLATFGFQLICYADMVAGSGVLEVLWAFTMVRLAGWHCTLWMAGEGPLLEEFRSFSNLASLPEDIHFVPDFRSEVSLPQNPDLILVPSRDSRWENLLAIQTSKTQITANKKGDQTGTNPSPKAKGNLISIDWKPHHICRVVMESLSALKRPGPQVPLEEKGKNIATILTEIANGKKSPTLEVGS